MENDVENISLEELSEIESLSIRSLNVCKWSRLNDLNSILDYYQEYGDFLRLRNCGQISNQELIEVCNKYGKLTEEKHQ